jgi:hypothetical protein
MVPSVSPLNEKACPRPFPQVRGVCPHVSPLVPGQTLTHPPTK